jgi:peptidoglycan hydrolase-like protein with peptidoglycan-binding domain
MSLPGADRPRAPAASADSSLARGHLAGSSTADRRFDAPTQGQDPGEAPQPGSPRRGRRIGALTAVLAAAVAAAAVALATSRSSPRGSSSTGVPPSDTTATVTRRTLTESSTVDGTLGYGSPLEIYDRLSGTFTWLPSAGAVIGRGGTLYRLDNLPVALMYGSVPAYRRLKSGVSDGPDVGELNRNLIDLGYDPNRAITTEDHFGEATAAAVRRWQKAEGLSQTGEVELGRIIFAPGARRITAVHVALGQDPPGATGNAQPDSGQPTPGDPASHQSATDEGSKERHANEGGAKEGGSKEGGSKEGESKEGGSKKGGSKEGNSKGDGSKEGGSKEGNSKGDGSKEGNSKGDGSKEGGSKGSGEGGAGGGELVLTTTSTQQIVQLKVKAEQQQLARVGESAPVTLPGGQTAEGRIIEVGSVATEPKENEKGAGGGEKGGGSGGEGSESATITATVALDHPVAHLDQAPVSVELVKSIRHDVLTVPATALTATSGGGYAIGVLEGGHRVALAVTPGMFANGYVQVEGPGVHEGLTVIESG